MRQNHASVPKAREIIRTRLFEWSAKLNLKKHLKRVSNDLGPFHAKCKKISKIQNNVLNFFYVNLIGNMVQASDSIKKKQSCTSEKIFLDTFVEITTLSVLDGTSYSVSLVLT